jgi:MFS family permease
MGSDVNAEVARLLGEGKAAGQVRVELESKGYSSDDVADAIAHAARVKVDSRTSEEKRNSRLLATREVFDRVGYGGAAPQFVNIIFWLSQASNPYILPIIGVLNGLKTLLSVVWSSIMREYTKLQRVSKNSIAQAGIIFGFSFLFMSFGIMLGGTAGLWLFAIFFLVGIVGIVAYGDLYQDFARNTIRKERMGGFLRSIAHWGVLITAVTLLIAGYLLDVFPMAGMTWEFMGMHLRVYGYLLAFEITAFSFIIAGYVSSLVTDGREERKYPFGKFLGEHYRIVRSKMHVFQDKYVSLLAAAALVSGFLQIIITAYSGIAIYQYLAAHPGTYPMPFFTLALIYAIAIIASFTGPFFTKTIHRSTGLAPTLVFGTLLMAVLPLVLVYNMNIVAIAAALCVYVIGGAITGFAQGVLAQKLMDEETRSAYFQAQSFLIIIPYLILIPLMAVAAMYWPLSTLFLIAAGSLILLVMPIYFLLVVVSQKIRL